MFRKVIENRKAKMIVRSLKIIFGTAVILMALSSCNNCPNNPGNGFDPENNVFFTAIPINGNVPRIYRSDRKGDQLVEIANNATIYSAPSENGKIAFIRNDPDRKINLLFRSDDDGHNQFEIESDNPVYGVAIPVISPDGNSIAFRGNNGLFLCVYNPSKDSWYTDEIADTIYPNTIQSFSPDGSKLAMIKGEISKPGFIVDIIDAENPYGKIYVKNDGNGRMNSRGESRISWTATGLTICYGYTDNTTDFIIVKNLAGSEKKYSIDQKDLGAQAPVISPDGNFVAFTSSDGNIWLLNLVSEAPVYSKLTSTDSTQRNIYPRWSPDGKYLLYNSFFTLDEQSESSTLYVLTLNYKGSLVEVVESIVLSNNSYRGFWRNAKGFGY